MAKIHVPARHSAMFDYLRVVNVNGHILLFQFWRYVKLSDVSGKNKHYFQLEMSHNMSKVETLEI